MRDFRILFTVLLISFVWITSANAISPERQREIIENFMYVTGQLEERPGQVLTDEDGKPLPIKCGTSAIADFILNRDKLDEGLMKSLGVQVYDRPPLIDEQTYDTPDGFFKIHYSTVGNDSVYKASVDNAPANGIPDYVDSVAWICDSVYNHIVNVLGYPSPPTDGFYDTLSGDSLYDVYLSDLYSGMYGQTWIDNFAEGEEGGQRVTSFIEIDKDYQGLSMYVDCPVDAARVTIAHEFFHAVQFGIDFTETELFIRNTTPPDTTVARYWM
ncbi:MAG: hypothetical protein U9N55_08730, partial [candidate division Zixibacteria bacterium]|nr:hypothetical protein [candidate division Zixibacteria bacterium]